MRRHLPLALAVFALALIVCFPMGVLLGLVDAGKLGLSVRAAHGSIWAGRLEDAQIGGVALGDVRARIAPLALLTGKAKLVLAGEGANPLRASIFKGLSGFGADGVTATLPVGNAFAPLPPASVSLNDAKFAFSGGRCQRAGGQIRLVFDALPEGMEFGRTLTGTPRCEGEAIAVTFIGASGMERVSLRIAPDGRYGGTIAVRGLDVGTAAKLAALGFRETQAGYVAKFGGRF